MKAVIMAGGTGGHVFPALAVARRLIADGWTVHWIGSQGGMEVELVGRNGIGISTLPVSGLRGSGLARRAMAPLHLLRSLWGAFRILHREKPRVVIGFGGFAAGPGGVAARLAMIPLVIHEQNAIAGLTNRLLSRIANRVLVAFPEATRQLPGARVVGNPVRHEILALPAPAEHYAGRSGALRVLVIGGSLGAKALNDTVPQAMALLAAQQEVEVRHQTGRSGEEEVRGAYARLGVTATVSGFIHDMADAYAWADLVVCRAGALTVSEIAAAGLPAVFVPYPHAVDDHQAHNAAYLVRAGAARTVLQHDLTPALLAETVRAMSARAELLAMAGAARKASFGDVAAIIARICKEVTHEQ